MIPTPIVPVPVYNLHYRGCSFKSSTVHATALFTTVQQTLHFANKVLFSHMYILLQFLIHLLNACWKPPPGVFLSAVIVTV